MASTTITGSSATIIIVNAEPGGQTAEIVGHNDFAIDREDCARGFRAALIAMTDYLSNNRVEVAFVKQSQAGHNTSTSHLRAAEIRGVVISACGMANVQCEIIAKSNVSTNFGIRKAKEYISDDDFWEKSVKGHALRSADREALLMLLFAIKS